MVDESKQAGSASEGNRDARAKSKRVQVKQTEVPSVSLEQAIRVPKAIAENYASKPTKPLHVAKAMGMLPSSGTFRQLTGAAAAYGLTSGSYAASEIAIDVLGARIVRPTSEDDEFSALREAFLRPRIIGEFLQHYNNSPFPRQDIAKNVLQEMGIPDSRVSQVLQLILEGAEKYGFIHDNRGRKYVDIDVITPASTNGTINIQDTSDGHETIDSSASRKNVELKTNDDKGINVHPAQSAQPFAINRRVFVTHGKNRSFIEPIKKLLNFGELEPVVSVERQSVSQPVPDKVMSDMRACGAAIIHVDTEQVLLDRDAQEHVVINPNVLIEIGAAMALYGRRIVLLVREGARLPSNLQGLYEVRYTGEGLDGDTTIKLLEAIRDIKNHPLPDRYTSLES